MKFIIKAKQEQTTFYGDESMDQASTRLINLAKCFFICTAKLKTYFIKTSWGKEQRTKLQVRYR